VVLIYEFYKITKALQRTFSLSEIMKDIRKATSGALKMISNGY